MAFLGEAEQLREYQERFRFLYFAVFTAIFILVARLIFLQIFNGDKMRQYSEENRIRQVRIAAPRGMIFDRNKTLLMDNRPSFDLEIIPQYLRESKQSEEVIALLSHLIGMPVEEIKEKLVRARGQPSFIPVKVKIDLNREEVARLKAWQLATPGASVEMEIQRANVFGDIGTHLLGYIGEITQGELAKVNEKEALYKLGDRIGKLGLEQRMETVLRGNDGAKLVEVDALGRIRGEKNRGRVLANSETKPEIPGNNLILTIDQDLQTAAAETFGDKSGAVVAIKPDTGEILSMVSRPSFNPTEFSRGVSSKTWQALLGDEKKPLRDKSIQDHYPPGSTFKTVTAIAALEEGIIDENFKVGCSGSIRVGNRTYHCHKKEGHGEVTIYNALVKSCDVFFWRVAQRMGIDQIAAWAMHLGLGKKTGIPLAQETSGLIPTEAWKQNRLKQPWHPGETLHQAIGQGYVLTTIIQLANTYATIANGGNMHRPFVVKAIESNDGKVIKEFKPEVIDNTQLKPETYRIIKKALWGVLNDQAGTAYSQRLPGMDVAGKTGTSQVISLSADKIYHKCENMPYSHRHHGLFAAFAPIDKPKIAVAVIAEHACHGGSGAAPVAKAIIKKYLEKHYPEEFAPDVLAKKLKEKGESAKVYPGDRANETEDIRVNEPILHGKPEDEGE